MKKGKEIKTCWVNIFFTVRFNKIFILKYYIYVKGRKEWNGME